jgi:hypothetical protein
VVARSRPSIEWKLRNVSAGNGAGYDIHSFDVDGQDRLLEVPVLDLKHECEAAEICRVRRVIHFGNDVKDLRNRPADRGAAAGSWPAPR